MNILPKKRWHVRTKENIARVRRDQAAAAEKEKIEQERKKLADGEARLALLKGRRGAEISSGLAVGLAVKPEDSTAGSSTAADASIYTDTGHVNFFTELEKQERTFGHSKEHAKESKHEQEEWEKKIGLLKYLGDGSEETGGNAPWYQRAPDEAALKRVRAAANAKPITKCDLPSILQRGPGTSAETIQLSEATAKRSAQSPLAAKRKKHKHKEKKHSKTKKRKEKERVQSPLSDADAQARVNAKIKKLAALREMRMQREAAERAREQQVLRKARGEPEPVTEKPKETGFKQRYNSQFNPEFARQNVPRVDR